MEGNEGGKRKKLIAEIEGYDTLNNNISKIYIIYINHTVT